MSTITLCTHQAVGHDITLAVDPLPMYRPGGHLHGLASKLGWKSFVWSWFEQDYKNQRQQVEQFVGMANWLDKQDPTSEHKRASLHSRLWVLRVPEEEVRYLGRANNRIVKGVVHYGKRLTYDSANACRRDGQLPECIIEHPVRPEYVVSVSDVIDSISIAVCSEYGMDPAVLLDSAHKWNRE